MKEYFYTDTEGKVQGPVLMSDLMALNASGKIPSTTQVTECGTEEWKSLFEISDEPKSVKSKPIDNKAKAVQPTHAPKDGGPPFSRWQGNVIIILLMIGLGLPHFALVRPPTEWEYKQLEIGADAGALAKLGDNYEKLSYKRIPNFETTLDMLGKEGWELVGISVEHETSHPNFGDGDYVTGIRSNVRPQRLICIFKRAKSLYHAAE
jgi:hypothetical protein